MIFLYKSTNQELLKYLMEKILCQIIKLTINSKFTHSFPLCCFRFWRSYRIHCTDYIDSYFMASFAVEDFVCYSSLKGSYYIVFEDH